MHRSKKKRNIVIFSLVGILLCMVVGYAAFQTRLEIKGTSKVTSNWNILITNVTDGTPTGSAENAVKPSWKNTSASMEANLYDKGDAMEYDVTIENKGTLDAKLNDILTNLEKENNEAVLITFSGYTKGEILKSGESKLVHVKIEYNPEYEGGETSSEVEINFDYGQNNNEENNPDEQYLLTYDYATNGGQSVDLNQEYISSGADIDLSNKATKEGWIFIGWNTDKDSNIGLKEYQMPKENTTLYAIYSKDLKVTYEKEDNIESIGKEEDKCTIYNNETSCEVTLPEINVSDDSAKVSWYDGENKVGSPKDKYTVKNDITLKAKAEFEPIIQSWVYNLSTDFRAEEYRSNIITATFLDNKNVPSNAIASWDVSANKNGSVTAWVVADDSDFTKYHLYIGGEGGVIANKDSSYLFYQFTNLQKITFGDNFDTSNVTNMAYMFYDCGSLIELDVSKFDTSSVTRMNYMFSDCSSLTTLDVSKWDTSNVTNMVWMFFDCSSLTTLDVSNFDTGNVTDMGYMFTYCSSLTTIDVSNWDTSKVTNMQSMFFECNSLATLDVSNWDTSNVTDMNGMFSYCSSLTTLDVSNWNTSKVTNMQAMFFDCSSLTTLDVSNWNTGSVTIMGNAPESGYTVPGGMFDGCQNLVTIDVSNWDTSNVTNMGQMFKDCSSLTTLDVSNWNTEKVNNMGGIFYGCNNLVKLSINNWDTSKVTNMQSMFMDCSSLTKLALCSFNTTNVTSMNRMFYGTSNLKSVYVGPNWTTENATTNYMFLNSGVSGVTQSDNCEIDAEEISLSISATSTTNSITVVANAQADSGIAKYEYSKDGGKIWESSTNNTYTFNGLTEGTSYNVQVRVTSNIGKISTTSSTVTTKSITLPTFKESETSDGKTVTITYPKGCGNGLTCTYQKDNGSIVNVTSNTASVNFTDSGSLVATVSDGTNKVSSSYNIDVTLSVSIGGVKVELATSGDGMYKDKYENNRYIYRGHYPNNYLTFNGETAGWRIMSKEADGTYKIVKDNSIGSMAFDTEGHRDNTSDVLNYCRYASVESMGKKGCNAWASTNNMNTSQFVLGAFSGYVYEDAELNTYLNTTYYNMINTNKDKIVNHKFNVGGIEYNSSPSMAEQIALESKYTWYGKIAIISSSDFLKVNLDEENCGTFGNYNKKGWGCASNNYLAFPVANKFRFFSTITPTTELASYALWSPMQSQKTSIYFAYANQQLDIYPTMYISSNIKLSGTGTESNPFVITN